LSTKIHALVEGLGQLARWELTGGQAHDLLPAERLIAGVNAQAIVADKAYDADELVKAVHSLGAEAVIPPRANRVTQRTFDVHRYKHRNIIERYFCRIKQFRRIATRYEKLASRFSAFIAIVASYVWLT